MSRRGQVAVGGGAAGNFRAGVMWLRIGIGIGIGISCPRRLRLPRPLTPSPSPYRNYSTFTSKETFNETT